MKLLSVMYLGRRHVNLRQTRDELDVQTRLPIWLV